MGGKMEYGQSTEKKKSTSRQRLMTPSLNLQTHDWGSAGGGHFIRSRKHNRFSSVCLKRSTAALNKTDREPDRPADPPMQTCINACNRSAARGAS